ncbi:unnamed protein product [Rhizophagus irregularis]|nr:unnamed protein product [Rhizophagus irregularis]
MGLQELFEEYFQDELDHKNFKPSNIHIIAITSITGSLKTGKTIGEIIKEITKDLKERKPKSSYESNDMPLQQRDFTVKIKETAVANVRRKRSNSNYWCIVSAGAPGIGKTRFGIELFDYIKQNWEPPEEWGDVHFEYLYMNFGNGFYLSGYDSELKLEVILGLWIAYAFFIEKKYDTTFQVFRSRALQYGKDIFIFDSVIYYYYESLKFSNNQKLFLYLHIDEFQMIDKWGAQNKTNQFFGNMIRCITKFTTEEYSTFIQPFLSGTAPRAIAKQREVTVAPLLQLLIDTGGLPRALERLLDSDLQEMYAINRKVYGEKELFMNLLYHCVEGIPVKKNKCLDNKGTTVRDLQTDGHFSLSPYGGQNLFLIEMPFFFVCIYNDILKIVDVNNNMYWQEWELFVAHHISFHVNLAIKLGKNELSLRNLHPGAYGTKENLDIVMKLKEQFPLNLNLTHGSEIPWNNGHCVVVNGTSAESSDIFYVMEDVSGVFLSHNGVEHSELQEYRDITIIFTTQPYEGSENLPEILIVSKDNFKSYFGPVFSARATFSLTRDINPNFWDINRLKNTIEGIGDVSMDTVIAKRPYISEDHFHNVNPGADKRQKLDFFPFDVQGTEIYAPDHLIEN